MKNLTLQNIAAACGGVLTGAQGREDTEISAVTTDSREVSDGCMFAAIAGSRVDGHDFIPEVLNRGAACVLAERMTGGCTGPAVLVPSVPSALQSIAEFYRRGFDIPVIGVTGSVGKTTAKEMLYAVLSQKYCVHKTAGNFNNELGVPLTLFGLREEHTAAVVEMGISDFGEMTRLTRMVRPDYALFTIIGHSHLETLGSREGVLRAKSELLQCVPENGTVFYNGDDDLLPGLECGPRRVVTFGLGGGCAVHAENVRALENGFTACDIVCGAHHIAAEIPAYGDHMVYAALAAAALGLELGLTDAEIERGIKNYEGAGHRSRMVRTGKITLIDDCYNANPTSTASAIRSLAKLPGRRVCILGDMLDMGGQSESLHRGIGAICREQSVDLLLTCGEMMRFAAEEAGERARSFESRSGLIAALPELIREGDAVLVKASHSMGFDEVCKALEAL